MKLSAGINWVMHVVMRVTTSVNFNRMILRFKSDLNIMNISEFIVLLLKRCSAILIDNFWRVGGFFKERESHLVGKLKFTLYKIFHFLVFWFVFTIKRSNIIYCFIWDDFLEFWGFSLLSMLIGLLKWFTRFGFNSLGDLSYGGIMLIRLFLFSIYTFRWVKFISAWLFYVKCVCMNK